MSLYKKQKGAKPAIEDVASEFLDADKTAAILELVKFIRANKIGIQWATTNSWALNYKGKRLGYIKIHEHADDIKRHQQDGSWSSPGNRIWRFTHNRLHLDKYYSMEDCDLKTFVFDHIYAKTCGSGDLCQCNPNAQKAGYMNSTGCGCWPLRIFNPNGEALEKTKRLIEFRKNCILEDSK